MPWARILLLFEAFGSGFPRPCVEMSSERFQRTNWRAYLARQECFLRCRRAIEKCFFMDSKGNVRTVFLARVLHALGANPAAVRGFRKRFFKAMCRGEFGGNPCGRIDARTLLDRVFFMLSEGDRTLFFYGFHKGDVRTVFLARVLHALGANPAAVRGFRKWFSKAMCRGEFGAFGSKKLNPSATAVIHTARTSK